jgi:steroid delta-isomerase-like uncharacterized protein
MQNLVSAGSASTPEKNAEIVRDFISEVWNAGDATAADRYLTSDYIEHAYDPKSVAGLKAMVALLATAFPDQRSDLEDCVAQGDRVIVRIRLTGTHNGTFRTKEATGKKIDVRAVRWFRMVDGKIAEHWALVDTLALFRQIEMLPPAPGPAKHQ